MTIQPDLQRHNAYLAVVGDVDELRQAMNAMALAAGTAAVSPAGLSYLMLRMRDVEDAARAYLDRLADADPPDYVRGADGDLHEAVQLIIDGARRGIAAARDSDGAGAVASAHEMDAGIGSVVDVAKRIAAWQTGAALP